MNTLKNRYKYLVKYLFCGGLVCNSNDTLNLSMGI